MAEFTEPAGSAAGGEEPVPAAAAPTGPPVLAPTDAPMAARACPHCNEPNAADAVSCQVCGRDFPADETPRDGGSGWVVELWVDPAWYEAQDSPDPLPPAGPPVVRPLEGRSLLIGRTSQSRNLRPDVDCLTDSGVSRRQSRLTTDGSHWWVEDLGSANGTFVGSAGGPLPEEPIEVGVPHELGPDDQIYVGAWTRLVIRPAADHQRRNGNAVGEQDAAASA